MKALTLKQPWADLIFTPVYDLDSPGNPLVKLGLKPIETRKWKTTYRGTILITTSRHPDHSYSPISSVMGICHHCGCTLYNACDDNGQGCHWMDAEETLCSACSEKQLHGYAIGLVDVIDCSPLKWTRQEVELSCCRPYDGAWGWLLANPRPIEPFSIKGSLSIWDTAHEGKYMHPGDFEILDKPA